MENSYIKLLNVDSAGYISIEEFEKLPDAELIKGNNTSWEPGYKFLRRGWDYAIVVCPPHNNKPERILCARKCNYVKVNGKVLKQKFLIIDNTKP